MENAPDDFPSKRSSNISCQTLPEVRHHFAENFANFTLEIAGAYVLAPPHRMIYQMLPFRVERFHGFQKTSVKLWHPMHLPCLNETAQRVDLVDFGWCASVRLPFCRAFVVMHFHSESVDFVMDFCVCEFSVWTSWGLPTFGQKIKQRNPQHKSRQVSDHFCNYTGKPRGHFPDLPSKTFPCLLVRKATLSAEF